MIERPILLAAASHICRTGWRCVLIFVTLHAGLIAGCSRTPSESVYPVRGQVLLDGNPLAEAFVVLHPLGRIGRGLSTHTDAAGEFTVTTNQPDDGAPAGEYAVTVEYRDLVQEGDDRLRTGPNRLPARYAQIESSGLRCRVQASSNKFDPWRLESR